LFFEKFLYFKEIFLKNEIHKLRYQKCGIHTNIRDTHMKTSDAQSGWLKTFSIHDWPQLDFINVRVCCFFCH